MSELGTRLREARVNKGYTLNTLQQMTKIQKKYLQALEEGNYEEIPGTFYIRAFTKQYGDIVGLDGEQLLVDYADELEVQNDQTLAYQPTQEDEDSLPSRLETRHSGEENKVETFISYIPLIILTGIILLIILILFMAIRDLSSVEEPDTQVTTQQTQSVVESVEPSSVVPETAEEETETTLETTEQDETTALAENQIQVGDQVVTLVSSAGSEATYQLEGPLSDYEFGIEANSFVWLGIYEDDSLTVDQTVSEGESFEYADVASDTQEIRLELGYPQGGVFTINGQEIEADSAVPHTILILVNPEERGATEELTLPTDDGTVEEETEETAFQGPAVYAPETNTGNE